MHQGAVNGKSRRLFPGSAQQPSQKNVESSKDQRLRGGEDRVGFVRVERLWVMHLGDVVYRGEV